MILKKYNYINQYIYILLWIFIRFLKGILISLFFGLFLVFIKKNIFIFLIYDLEFL